MPLNNHASDQDIQKKLFYFSKEHYVAWSNHCLGLLAVAAMVVPQICGYNDVDVIAPPDIQPVPGSIQDK